MQNNKSDKEMSKTNDEISTKKLNQAVDAKDEDKAADAVVDKVSQEAKAAENFNHGDRDAGAKK